VAEGVRLRNRSGRRIRAQKYPGGAGSFNLIRVRPQVRFRDAGHANSALSAGRCSGLGPEGLYRLDGWRRRRASEDERAGNNGGRNDHLPRAPQYRRRLRADAEFEGRELA
jgi:hypothetical protein